MPTETGKSENKFGYKDKEKPTQIRFSNITAAKGSSSCLHRCYFLIIMVLFVACYAWLPYGLCSGVLHLTGRVEIRNGTR